MAGQQAVFDLAGATCASCAFAIVDYHGDNEALEQIPKIVDTLGYRAVRKE